MVPQLRHASLGKSLAKQSSASHMMRRNFSQTQSRDASWGFIGLGQMGYRMAKNLRNKLPQTDTLIIHDVNEGATAKFVKETAGKTDVAQSVREVAERSETIITALPEPQHVTAVYKSMIGDSGLPELSSKETQRLFIDCSTIDPMTSGTVSELISSHGGKFIDAPMSGGTVGAEAGTLTFMLGADSSIVDRATSILSMMGKKALHMGPPGSGLKAKLANNYLLALNNLATCEAMNMGVRWGLDPKALADMINISTGRCWPSEVNNPVPGVVEKAPASRDYEGGFGVSLMSKDLRLAIKAAEEYRVSVEMGKTARRIYEDVEGKLEYRAKDFSVVYRAIGGKE